MRSIAAASRVFDQAEDRVAHDQRRLGRVEHDDGLSLFARRRRCSSPRAVVWVNSSMFARVPGPAERLAMLATISA